MVMELLPKTLNPWELAVAYFQTFAKTFAETRREQRREKEAKLQLTLATPAAAPSPEAADRHLVTRLVKNAAALRPFLAHNELLTDNSDLPVIHVIEAAQAKTFAFEFKKAEGALQHHMGVPYRDWNAPNSFRDELSKAIANDGRLYQQVAGFSHSSRQHQLEVINTLARQLQAGEKQKSAQQME